MHRWPTWSVFLLAILVAGCAVAEVASQSEATSPAGTRQSPVEPSTSLAARQPLPSGFPVLTGAVAVAMPEGDPGLIGLWESDQVGSVAYDFYVDALSGAGYPIVGLFPGGDVALIRFQAPDGNVWQVVAHGSEDGGTTIEVRLDRP